MRTLFTVLRIANPFLIGMFAGGFGLLRGWVDLILMVVVIIFIEAVLDTARAKAVK